MTWSTADLVDRYGDAVSSCDVQFRNFGGRVQFYGLIRTIRTFEDNALVRSLLGSPGSGSVLVVDGGGSLRTALAGDMLAALAVENGWAGMVLFGAVRDSRQLAAVDVGIKALGTNPFKSGKLGSGAIDVPLNIGGVLVTPGDWLYSDEDGILVSSTELHIEAVTNGR